MPGGKRDGFFHHAQRGDLKIHHHIVSISVFDCRESLTSLLEFLDNLELSFMKLSSFQSFARLDGLNFSTPFSSSSILSCWTTSSISSLNGCVYSVLVAKSKMMKVRAFVVVLIEAKDTFFSPLEIRLLNFAHSTITNKKGQIYRYIYILTTHLSSC